MTHSSCFSVISRVMTKFSHLLLLVVFALLSSCAQNPDGVLKRSANDRLLDVNGFDGSKRRPIYNKKYIARAKKNVQETVYEDEIEGDELDELYDPSVYHRQMYESMVERDREYNNKLRKKKKPYVKALNASSDRDKNALKEADMRLKDIPRRDVSAIEQEVQALRQMLEETKSELMQQREQASKAKEAAALALEQAKASMAEESVSMAAQQSAEEAKKESQYQEESLRLLQEKRETLKEQLLSDQSLLSATSDKDLASEVIKVIDGDAGQNSGISSSSAKK